MNIAIGVTRQDPQYSLFPEMARVLLIGDSRVRDFGYFLRNTAQLQYTIEMMPGATLSKIFDHTLLLLDTNTFDMVMIHGGVCNILSKRKFAKSKFDFEIDDIEKFVSDIREDCVEFQAKVLTAFPTIKVCLNTLIGVELNIYNGIELPYTEPPMKKSLGSKSVTPSTVARSFKSDGTALTKSELAQAPFLKAPPKAKHVDQQSINDLVIAFNKMIVEINGSVSLTTPRTADYVHKNRSKKGKVIFQHSYRYLVDGCHYHNILTKDITTKVDRYICDVLHTQGKTH